MTKRHILLGAVLGGLLVLGPAGIASAQNPYTGAVSSTTVTPGGIFTYSAAQTGWPSSPALASMTPDAEFLTANTATYMTSATGALTFDVRIPATATPGSTFSLTVTVGDGEEVFLDTATITVAALPVDAGADGTAVTGLDALPYLWFGGGLLALGIAVVVVLTVLRRGRATIAE